MKLFFLFFAIILSAVTEAQVTSVSLQASGLTCSMCSNSINKALKTLDFVLNVDPDIKTYTFEISFKPGSDIDFDMIRKKVEKAGFAVSSFVAAVHFNNIQVKNNKPIVIQGKTFLFVNAKEQILSGVKRVKIMDKGFVSQKENRKNSFLALPPQTYHVTL